MKSFIPWVGGKSKLLWLIRKLSPSRYSRFIDVFGGSGTVTLSRPIQPGCMEVYNDFNSDLTNLFCCVKNRTMALLQELGFLPLNTRDDFNVLYKFFSKEEFTDDFLKEELELTERYLEPPDAETIRRMMLERAPRGDVRRAADFFKLIRYSFSGGAKSFAGKSCDIRRFFYLIWECSRRLADVVIENKDCVEIVRQYDRPDAFLYFDPPYYDAEDCPKNTREITNRLYFSGSARTILTSATLTNATEGSLEEQYAYFISNTGFPTDEHGCLSEPKPSPYPYDEHSMIYYCDDLPHPTKEHEAFIEQGVQRLLEVLDISGGKALVLFTAKTDMEEVYSILSQKELPYKVLMQQPGSSQDQVLNEFKEDTNSVLLGTGAYWEGISIEGKSLSNVVIFRLPFPVPDPIIEYKASIAKDPLMDVRVPEMVIKLKQGIGRLIRNFTDTGIVCIIDRRLRDAPAERYHDIAWASLPIKNRTKDLGELRRFYESLPAAHNETEG